MNRADWLALVQCAQWETLDDRWLEAIEGPQPDRESLLAVLDALVRAGQGERAAALGWMWLASLKDRAGAAEALGLAKDLVFQGVGGDQLRAEIAALYREVFGGRPGIERLIAASGLMGDKSLRRAVRTIEVGVQLTPGSCLVSRGDDTPAEVIEVDLEAGRFALRTPNGRLDLDPDQLAAGYDPVPRDDFRVLTGLDAEGFGRRLRDDPVPVVIGLLRSRGGRMDADDLRYTLTPKYLAADEWSGWWSKVRAAARRHGNLRIEGRNPPVLIYDEAGRSIEDEARARWNQARTAEERLAAVETYLREAAARKTPVQGQMLREWAAGMAQRIEDHKEHPVEALRAAVVLDRLRRTGEVAMDGPSPIESILAGASDPTGILRDFLDSEWMGLLLDQTRSALPGSWPRVFLDLLPSAPPDLADEMVDRLLEAGRREDVQAIIRQAPGQPLENLRLLTWLWRGPKRADAFELPPRIEILGRMLGLLAELARKEATPSAQLKAVRATVRTALTARRHAAFREAVAGIDPALAETIHRQIARSPGLSSALVHDLTQIIRQEHPTVFARARLEAWEEPNVIYTTERGRRKAEEELNFLVNVKMPENAKAIGAAASHGDLSENSEYKFALEERDLLRARVARLQSELAMARLIEPHIVPRDRVGVGSRVRVRSLDGQVEREMVFLGPWDADIDAHVYNYQAPLSRRMMGLRTGHTIELDLDGVRREYRIESIESAVG